MPPPSSPFPAPPYPYSEVGHYESEFGLKDTHDKMLGILLAFDAFCRRHGISYSIADGTLLGALRHGDFIPWDDDADVMVTRPEYDKIRAAIADSSEIRLLKIAFLDRITTPEAERDGFFVDLFINDEMPTSELLFRRKKWTTLFLRGHFFSARSFDFRRANDSFLKRSARRVAGETLKFFANRFIGNRDVFELNDAFVQLGDAPGRGIYTRFTSRMFETRRRFDKASYDAGFVDIPFRGTTVMALKNGATFLREMYGDFETLPPETSRRPVHTVNMLETPDWFKKHYNG